MITIDDVRAAGSAIRQAIADADGPLPPAFLIEFLLSEWRRYLVYLHHQHGVDSAPWASVVDVTRRLLLSVLPLGDADQRSLVSQGLLRLVGEVRVGIAVAGMADAASERFLGELRAVHLALLNAPEPAAASLIDLSQTFAVNTLDPRYRALLDRLDGLDSVEHINM